MGLFYDNINDVLYTCSEDKTIHTNANKESLNSISILIIQDLFNNISNSCTT